MGFFLGWWKYYEMNHGDGYIAMQITTSHWEEGGGEGKGEEEQDGGRRERAHI